VGGLGQIYFEIRGCNIVRNGNDFYSQDIFMNTFDDFIRLAFARQIWSDFQIGWKDVNLIKKFAVRSNGIGSREKESSWDKLEKLKDRDDIFLSYISELKDPPSPRGERTPRYPKIGINPKSHYNTPLGVYTYPIKEIWGKLSKGDLSNVPYQGEKPYIAVLQLREGKKFVQDMYKDYDSSDYDDDRKKLHNYFVPKVLSEEEFNQVVDKASQESSDKNPITSMWNIARYLAYIIVQFKDRDVDRNAILDKVKEYGVSYLMPYKVRGKLNPYGLIFNRILSDDEVLGYAGFADRTGKSYIHSGEPIQAIFLDPSGYNVLDILPNESSDEYIPLNPKIEDGIELTKKMQDNRIRSKIRSFIEKMGAENISEDVWRQILAGHPDFIKSCPYKNLLDDPSIIKNLDKYWSKKALFGDIINFNPEEIPIHIDKLPETKRALKEAWERNIKEDPTGFKYAPDYVKNDPRMGRAHKEGWESYLMKAPMSWNDCPFEEVKKNKKVIEKAQEYFIDRIRYDVRDYAYVPEDLKNGELHESAVFEFIEHIKNDPTYYLSPNLESLRSEPRVLDIAREEWKTLIKHQPIQLDRLPKELKEESDGGAIYRDIAKNTVMGWINSEDPVNSYYGEGGYNCRVPKELMEKDKDIFNAVIEKWVELIRTGDIYIAKETPKDLLNIPQIIDQLKKTWKAYIMDHPYSLESSPFPELQHDEDIWKSILSNEEFSGEFWPSCPFEYIKNDPRVIEIARNWWIDALKKDIYLIQQLPSELGLDNLPSIKKIKIKYIKERSKHDPRSVDTQNLDEEEREAWMSGAKYHAKTFPAQAMIFNESERLELMQDPLIRKTWFNTWKNIAVSNWEDKIENPFGHALYNDPEVINKISDYIEKELSYGNPVEKCAIDGLIEKVKNDPKLQQNLLERWKNEISSSDQYRIDKVYDIAIDRFASDKEAIKELKGVYFNTWAEMAKNSSLLHLELTPIVVDYFSKRQDMREWLMDQWLKVADRTKISDNTYFGGAFVGYNTPPSFVQNDQRFINVLEDNRWSYFLRHSPSKLNEVPPEVMNLPKVKYEIEKINASKGSNEIHTEEPAAAPLETGEKDIQASSQRTLWASTFNDNVIINI